MRLLLSNDDGVYAQGLTVLAKNLADIADVYIFAPMTNRSGASHSLTLDRPLCVQTLDDRTFAVDGSPTDCIHLALTGLLDFQPDMVISGINHGANLADDSWYSGTIAAATESALSGIPAFAVSLVDFDSQRVNHFDSAAQITKRLIEHYHPHSSEQPALLNINVPNVPLDQLSGLQATVLGRRQSQYKRHVATQNPRGDTLYWIGAPCPSNATGKNTDFDAIAAKQVSVTPLSLNITDWTHLSQTNHWLQCIK